MQRLLLVIATLGLGCGLAAYDALGVAEDATADGGPDASIDAGEADAGAPDAGEPDAGAPDAGDEPDAGPACVAAECGSAGCCGARCCAVVPANAVAIGAIDGEGALVLSAEVSFDTSTCSGGVLGACTPSGGLCVCRSASLEIGANGGLAVVGSRPLVLVASRRIDVRGIVNVSASPTTAGPGARSGKANHASTIAGGAGGSHGTLGGDGGAPVGDDGADVTAPPVSGEAFEPLVGGRAGQGTSNAVGGRGGGAIQLVAGERIEITGELQAHGAGGEGVTTRDTTQLGGAGGGSGGTVLLQAPLVIVTGGIWANGGGGGGGQGTGSSVATRSGAPGASGRSSLLAAAGGQAGDGYECLLGESVVGGDGGDGATRTTTATTGAAAVSTSCTLSTVRIGGGGGGGGLGLIRIDGSEVSAFTGSFSPAPTFGQIVYD